MPGSSPPRPHASRSRSGDFTAWTEAAAEVEDIDRAIAALEGKHPDEVARLRRARTDAEERHRELSRRIEEHKAAAERYTARRARRRWAAAGAVAAGCVVLAAFVWAGARRRGRWKAVDAALDAAAAPYVAAGFVARRALVGRGDRIETLIPPERCLVAVAAAEQGEGRLRLERGQRVVEGKGTIGWCTCVEERTVVRSDGDEGALHGVRLLSTSARATGGGLNLGRLDPPPRLVDAPGAECAEQQLDGWLADRRFVPTAPDDALPDAWSGVETLRRTGFRVVARAAEREAYAVVDGAAESCFLSARSNDSDLLSLRIAGGARALVRSRGPLAWCAHEPVVVTLWRDGVGPVAVVGAPSRRLGGLLGTREIARRAGLGEAAAWIRPQDLGRDAADALRASTGADATVSFEPGEPAPPRHRKDARVVAFSVVEGGAVAGDPLADVTVGCAPEARPAVSQAVCVQTWPQLWHETGAAGRAGTAEGPLPFWLGVMTAVDDARGVAAEATALALARRLAAEGFEPTTLDGVEELEHEVEVTGRGGFDAIVAVGLAPAPPWAYPLSDGVAWALAGEPRVLELRPGDRMLLTASSWPHVPKENRRTVVFRRRVPSPAK